MTITFWETEGAEQSSRQEARKIRAQVSQESGQAIQSLETYEVWMRLGKT